jgi:hypothetical protein
MKNLRNLIILVSIMISGANAQTDIADSYNNNRYADLTYNYFYGKDSDVSVGVRRVIAGDPKSSEKVLQILTNDKDIAVWLLAEDNLKGYI